MNRKSIALMMLIVCFAGLSARAQQEQTQKLVILHTNDLHSRLNGFSPEADYSPLTCNDDHTRGGFARIATLIREEKASNVGDVLVVDAGDFLMGTLFPAMEESDGFQLGLMKRMGYDVVTLGNHEFDFGPEKLAGILHRSFENNPIPQVVSSNLVFSAKNPGDDSLKAAVDHKILKSCAIIEKNGLKLGIFGILGKNAIHDAPKASPLKFEDPVKTAAKYVSILREKEKVDLVICLSHSGLSKDQYNNWTGEDVRLAREVPGIDVIISGHTHTLLEKPLLVNGIPIVQTGSYGIGLGYLELEIIHGKIAGINGRIIPVTDAVKGDPEIQQMIVNRENQINEKILSPFGLSYSTLVAETSFPLVCDEDTLLENSNLGELITDAVYSYVNGKNPPGTDITLIAAGMVRDNIIPGTSGKQSLADIFRVVSLGNGRDNIPGYPLARVFVTGKELKGIMEVLYLAPSSSPDNYIYFGGLKATYDPERGLLKKITSIETGNAVKGYKPVDWSKENKQLYSITADTYLLQFVSIIKKLSKGLVRVTLKNEQGEPLTSIDDALIDDNPGVPGVQEVKEWMAFLWFLQQQPDNNNNGIPDIPDRYKTGSPRLHRE